MINIYKNNGLELNLHIYNNDLKNKGIYIID